MKPLATLYVYKVGLVVSWLAVCISCDSANPSNRDVHNEGTTSTNTAPDKASTDPRSPPPPRRNPAGGSSFVSPRPSMRLAADPNAASLEGAELFAAIENINSDAMRTYLQDNKVPQSVLNRGLVVAVLRIHFYDEHEMDYIKTPTSAPLQREIPISSLLSAYRRMPSMSRHDKVDSKRPDGLYPIHSLSHTGADPDKHSHTDQPEAYRAPLSRGSSEVTVGSCSTIEFDTPSLDNIIDCLLQAGADPHAEVVLKGEVMYGQEASVTVTALKVAQNYKDDDLVKLFEERKAPYPFPS